MSKLNFTIVEEVQAFLKLGDTGKLLSFFKRINTTLEGEIEANETNIKVHELKRKSELNVLKDKIADAKEAAVLARLSVDMDRLSTNISQKEYQDEYLSNISTARRLVVKLTEEEAEINKKYDLLVKECKEDIDSATALLPVKTK